MMEGGYEFLLVLDEILSLHEPVDNRNDILLISRCHDIDE